MSPWCKVCHMIIWWIKKIRYQPANWSSFDVSIQVDTGIHKIWQKLLGFFFALCFSKLASLHNSMTFISWNQQIIKFSSSMKCGWLRAKNLQHQPHQPFELDNSSTGLIEWGWCYLSGIYHIYIASRMTKADEIWCKSNHPNTSIDNCQQWYLLLWSCKWKVMAVLW